MNSILKPLGAAASLLLLTSAVAFAEGDVKKGAKVFKKCKACHVVDAEKLKTGPHLVGIINRPVASVASFDEKKKYSGALKEWGEGKVWDEETLAEFLKKPKKVVKGTKMAFAGLRKDSQIADVIAYLTEKGGVTE